MSFLNDPTTFSRLRDSSASLLSKGQMDEIYEKERMLSQIIEYGRINDTPVDATNN